MLVYKDLSTPEGVERYNRRLQQVRQWKINNPDRIKSYKRVYNPDVGAKRYKKYKDKLFEILGGKKCKICGFNDERALQFDHINGGGTTEFRKYGNGISMLSRHLKDPNVRNKLQVLCSNCNWIKRVENKEVKLI